MSEELFDLAIETAGGHKLWSSLRGLKVDISIGGPIWALKGWPPGRTFDQVLTLDTVTERIVFTPFTRPDQEMVFDAGTDRVTMQTLSGEQVEILAPARAAFKGMLRNSAWDALHLGYFLGYACWNYLTTPFLFSHSDVQAREIEPWREVGQTWRRLQVRFPRRIATHNPDQVFYFDTLGIQAAWTTSPKSTAALSSATTPAATTPSMACSSRRAAEFSAGTPTTRSTSTSLPSPSTSTTSN
jgi:hypothetical protein